MNISFGYIYYYILTWSNFVDIAVYILLFKNITILQ